MPPLALGGIWRESTKSIHFEKRPANKKDVERQNEVGDIEL